MQNELIQLQAFAQTELAGGVNTVSKWYTCSQYAYKLAQLAHAGQKDKAGKPYVGHLYRVAMKARNQLEFCVAMLHDICEDTGITPTQLLNDYCFPSSVVDAVVALTKIKGESYSLYIGRVSVNHTATQVKLYDIMDNADITRFDYPTKEDQIRCSRYLERAMVLKTSIPCQSRALFSYVHSLIQIAGDNKMVVHISEPVKVDAKSYYLDIGFGYPGTSYHDIQRCYVVTVNMFEKPDGHWVGRINTYSPSDSNYKPQQMSVHFTNEDIAVAHIQDLYALIEMNPCFVEQELSEPKPKEKEIVKILNEGNL